MLEGNFDQVVGSDTLKFLQECTSMMSLSHRNLECVDVRSGSIVLDMLGQKAALDVVMTDIMDNGLKLPSYPKLVASGASARDCTLHHIYNIYIWEGRICRLLSCVLPLSISCCLMRNHHTNQRLLHALVTHSDRTTTTTASTTTPTTTTASTTTPTTTTTSTTTPTTTTPKPGQ